MFLIRYTCTAVVTKTRNDPQWPTTIHNDPQRPTTIHNDPQLSTTIPQRPTTTHNDPQRRKKYQKLNFWIFFKNWKAYWIANITTHNYPEYLWYSGNTFIRLSKTGQNKWAKAGFHERESPFRDTFVSTIDVSSAGHRIKICISHMKSFISFVLRKHPCTFVPRRAILSCRFLR